MPTTNNFQGQKMSREPCPLQAWRSRQIERMWSCQEIDQMQCPSLSITVGPSTFLGDSHLARELEWFEDFNFYLGMEVPHDAQQFKATLVRFDARGNVFSWRFK